MNKERVIPIRPETRPLADAHRAETDAGLRKNTYLWVKTPVEWLAALVLLILSIPLLAGLAVLLRCTSEGPAFYQQTRLGRRGKHFQIHKLRTMTHRCEAATGPVWSLADDPRVTGIGRWLRDTHLDELPQLWNVVRGEMSLIGPRPERPSIAAEIQRAMPAFGKRLEVRPGITGLAQVRLPPDSDIHTVRRKLAHDLQYIARMGPGMDILIVLSTVMLFVGMAATTISRWLADALPAPKAPEGHDIPIELVEANFRLGDLHAAASAEEVSKAA